MTFADARTAGNQHSVVAPVRRFGDEYWLGRDDDGSFPQAIAEAGWLGIAMSEAYRGSGLGRPFAASRQVAAQPVTVDSRFTHDAFASSSIPYRNNDAAYGQPTRVREKSAAFAYCLGGGPRFARSSTSSSSLHCGFHFCQGHLRASYAAKSSATRASFKSRLDITANSCRCR